MLEGGVEVVTAIGPLHDPVTWYKITHAGEQVAKWDFQNNAPAFVLEVPQHNLLTSMCDFVPCDRVVQRAHFKMFFVIYWDVPLPCSTLVCLYPWKTLL